MANMPHQIEIISKVREIRKKKKETNKNSGVLKYKKITEEAYQHICAGDRQT